MTKIKLILFVLYSMILSAGVYSLANYLADPRGDSVIEDKTEIKYNTVYRDTNTMSLKDMQNDLQCFYTGFPALDVQSVGKNDYMLSASLCDRKWQKVVTIKPRDSPRNIIIVGPFIDSELKAGAWAQYYRLYGRIGLGGGVALRQGYVVVQGGVALVW